MAIQAEKGGDDAKAMQAKKVYYLACGFCRWSSRDVGIEDKSVGELKLPSVEQIMASCMYSNHFFFLGGGRREEGGGRREGLFVVCFKLISVKALLTL